ncbi:hypothetical protein ACHHYP_01822 [Achlya hypogyna]|uniref:Uncharacterized protein n=1 Tax=Achlya hypogyna TaxID=1202772 RepID=A0A1V9ZSV9_ACHHY|nr:hypothetical protein ACHHYP_01822 [Achlya hypogyna]
MELDGERYARFNERMKRLACLKPEVTSLSEASHDAVQVHVVEIFENQQRRADSWHRKYLEPDMPPFTTRGGTPSLARFPKQLPSPVGFQWRGHWRPCMDGPCDPNGWLYAESHAELLGGNGSARPRDVDVSRRRRWVRVLVSFFVPFKWKQERLGVALVEPMQLDQAHTVAMPDAATGPLHIAPVGGQATPIVAHVDKANLRLCATVSRGDALVCIDGRAVRGLSFAAVQAQLLTCATLTVAPTTRRVHILSCHRDAAKAGLAPGYELVGLNERSLRRVRLLDVELLLRTAPKHSCVLYFQAATTLGPPFVEVAAGVVGLVDTPKPRHGPRAVFGSFGTTLHALFARTG